MPVINGPSKTIAQIVVKGILAAAGSTAKTPQIRLGYRISAGAGPFSKLALSNAFEAGPYAAMLAAFNIGWSSGTTNIRFLDDVTDPEVTTTLAGVGAIATDRLPTYAAVYVLLKTAIRGRWAQGSKHFPCGNEIDTTGDVLTGAGLARWTNVAASLVNPLLDVNGVTWTPCVVSFKRSQARFTPERITYNDIANAILNLDLGTMKKRKVQRVI